jgi:hypothetical protein
MQQLPMYIPSLIFIMRSGITRDAWTTADSFGQIPFPLAYQSAQVADHIYRVRVPLLSTRVPAWIYLHINWRGMSMAQKRRERDWRSPIKIRSIEVYF